MFFLKEKVLSQTFHFVTIPSCIPCLCLSYAGVLQKTLSHNLYLIFSLIFFVNSFSVVLMKAWSIKYKFTQRTLCREPFVMLNFKVLLKTNYIVKTLGTILAFKFFCRLVPDIKFLQHLPLLSIYISFSFHIFSQNPFTAFWIKFLVTWILVDNLPNDSMSMLLLSMEYSVK